MIQLALPRNRKVTISRSGGRRQFARLVAAEKAAHRAAGRGSYVEQQGTSRARCYDGEQFRWELRCLSPATEQAA